MFSIEELNESNYDSLSKLKISDIQKNYVLDFNGCINYKKRFPFLKIYGIKKDDTYIGLTAFARWDSDESIPIDQRWTWFDEFWFDLKYQGHGYAKDVIDIILNKIKEIYNPKFVILSVRNDNEVAKKLYEEIGFIKTDMVYIDKTDSIIHKEKFSKTDEYVMYKYL